MQQIDIINEIENRFGEWLEHAGEKSPELLVHLLCTMVIKERELNLYYKRRLDYVSTISKK